jgi:Nitrile hydratase beta subunit
MMMRGPHDLGGLPAGPVDTQPHEMTFWEKQIDALNLLLAQKGLRKTDENRRYIEMLGHDAYNTLTYYERWTAAVARILIDKGVFTQDEIDAKVAEIRGRLGEDAA